jgi:hypothetical protein
MRKSIGECPALLLKSFFAWAEFGQTYTGTMDRLRWEIAQFIEGTLTTNGRLFIVVQGWVFKDGPSVPPELRGKNDEAEFRGLVSCLTEEGETVVTKNIITEGFPATVEGNPFINAQLELPNPCVAPIIMVLAGSEEKWFAVTGFEATEK